MTAIADGRLWVIWKCHAIKFLNLCTIYADCRTTVKIFCGYLRLSCDYFSFRLMVETIASVVSHESRSLNNQSTEKAAKKSNWQKYLSAAVIIVQKQWHSTGRPASTVDTSNCRLHLVRSHAISVTRKAQFEICYRERSEALTRCNATDWRLFVFFFRSSSSAHLFIIPNFINVTNRDTQYDNLHVAGICIWFTFKILLGLITWWFD